jgi:hypothetical protein
MRILMAKVIFVIIMALIIIEWIKEDKKKTVG